MSYSIFTTEYSTERLHRRIECLGLVSALGCYGDPVSMIFIVSTTKAGSALVGDLMMAHILQTPKCIIELPTFISITLGLFFPCSSSYLGLVGRWSISGNRLNIIIIRYCSLWYRFAHLIAFNHYDKVISGHHHRKSSMYIHPSVY